MFFRSAVAVNGDPEQLEELGNYLRTLSIQTEPSYRDTMLHSVPLMLHHNTHSFRIRARFLWIPAIFRFYVGCNIPISTYIKKYNIL